MSKEEFQKVKLRGREKRKLTDNVINDLTSDISGQAGQGLAAIGAGGLTALGITALRKKLKFRKEWEGVPLTMASLTGGSGVAAGTSAYIADNRLKRKGVITDKAGLVSKATPSALEKYSADMRTLEKLMNRGAAASLLPFAGAGVGYVSGDDENKGRNALIGAGVGTAAAVGMGAHLGKKIKKNLFGDGSFGGGKGSGGGGGGGGRGGGGGGFNRRGPSMDQAASDIGVKYEGGKFYDKSGNPITTKKDVKKAYKRSAMKWHPDRGGSEEQFKKVNTAFNDVIRNSSDFEKLSHFLKKYASSAKEKSNSKWAAGTTGFVGALGADIGYNAIKHGNAIKGYPAVYAGMAGFTGGAAYDWSKNRKG